MNTIDRTKRILTLAIGAVLLGAGSAAAQYRVGEDGRLLDASNRLGSGGYNSGVITGASVYANGNRLITGNVTGAKEFRGNVDYKDPREFAGTVAGEDFDRFIRRSSGIPQPYQAQTHDPNQVNVFYGRALSPSQAPANAVPQGASNTFIVDPNLSRPAQDTRLGVPPEGAPAVMPRLGELLLPGPVDPRTNVPSVVSASPLLGVQQYRLDDPLAAAFAGTYTGMRQDTGPQRLGFDDASLQRMRDELARTVEESRTGGISDDGATDQGPTNNLAKPLPEPFESPANPGLTPKALDTSLKSPPLSNDVRPTQSSFARLPAPTQQSSTNAELERRLARYYLDRFETDETRNREFIQQLRQRENARGNPGGAGGPAVPPNAQPPAPRTAPDYQKMSRELLNTEIKGVPGNAPLQIKSLASGIKAEGLLNVMTKAEELLRQGKYVSAVDQYRVAEQVAPNNALVRLGRSHAELGAGYYAQAAAHLRQAMEGDPSIMMGQYDLKGMIGEARLGELVKDLKDTAAKETANAALPFLLAYVAYNTGNEAQATVYLDLADKRVEQKDPFYRLVKKHWAVSPQGS
jgi:tetratricopeptide (TPR) repeat protein